MNDMRYALIRFIPDMDRMEPINVGIILQGEGRIDFQLSPHAAKRKDIETTIFQRWRTFFEEEIRGNAVPLLQPSKDSAQFLVHLAGLCEHTVAVTKPLALAKQCDESFEQVLQSLYHRLVAPPEQRKKGQPPRPTSQYRDLEEEKCFRKRGMKRHPYVTTHGKKRWNAYRQAINGENIVVDKIEVGNLLGYTADEIQKLSSGVEGFLDSFLNPTSATMPPRYYLIADQLTEKFTEQSDDDFHAMQEEIDRVVQTVFQRGGTLVRQSHEVHDFARYLDEHLPQLEEATRFSPAG